MQSRSFLQALLLTLLLAGFQRAHAEEAATTSGEAPILKGEVVQIEVTLNNLRDARLSISRVRKATANLYDEVTRQEVTMSYNPNMVGTSVIMTPRANMTGRTLPARKKWINASMAEISPIITLFKEDVDAAIESHRRTDVSDETRTVLHPLRDAAFLAVKSSSDTFKQLEELTAGPTYDNQAIASAAQTLDAEMTQLDRALKKGISILRKEAKSSKKA